MIVEHNPALRAEENCVALQAQLDYLSFKVGFGTRHYRFSGDRVVTATQYAGERQEMFRNASRHYLHMEQFLRALVLMAWYFAAELQGMPLAAPVSIAVDFDDSFFIDPAAERERDLSEVRAGIMAPWEYRVKYYGDSEEHARETAGMLAT
jgi:A118 family predicted phage portal protein